MRLHGATYLADLPTLIAENEGFFTRRGLDLRPIERDTGKDNLIALKDGRTDFALMTLTPLVLDRLSNQKPPTPEDPVILASLVYSATLNHVVVERSSVIREPSDLDGKRVGLMKGTNSEYLWWLFSTYHRLDATRVTLVDIAVKDQPDALVAGDVDALVTWEPWTSRFENRAGASVEVLSGSELYHENWVLVSTRETVTQHTDTVQQLLRAYQDAITFIKADTDRAFEEYADFTGLNPGRLRDPHLSHFELRLDWSLLFDLQQMIRWAEETQGLTSAESLDILSWIEPGPLRDVLPSHVGIPLTGAVSGVPRP
jgi:ABC-type nitrate/sulfonate/bicarbonate transport system substrate-binding protein